MSDDGSSRDRLLRQKNEFIESFFKKGAEFTRELLDENDNLRRRIVELQELRAGAGSSVSKDTLKELIERIHALEKEREAMLARLTSVDDLEDKLSERFEEIERENHDLAALYVAQGQLHAAHDVPELVRVCVEVLLNFVGASDFAIMLADGSATLRLFAVHGIQMDDAVHTGGIVAETFASGQVQTSSAGGALGGARSHASEEPYVCLPLVERSRTIGVIPIWGFLAQKTKLAPVDHQIFDMLVASVGFAMEAAHLAATAPDQRLAPYEQYSALV